MPGAQCTRSLVCEVVVKKCTRVFTAVAPEITRHPRTQWFTAYFALSPVIGLSCHRHRRRLGCRLDAGVEASGPHDFAVRITRCSSRAHPRPSHPPRVRDDRDTPLEWGETAGVMKVICEELEGENFSRRDWTGRNSLNGLDKFDFARRRS